MPWLLPLSMEKVWLNQATLPPKTSWSDTVTSALTLWGATEFSAIVTDRLCVSKTGGSSASSTRITYEALAVRPARSGAWPLSCTMTLSTKVSGARLDVKAAAEPVGVFTAS